MKIGRIRVAVYTMRMGKCSVQFENFMKNGACNRVIILHKCVSKIRLKT
jgi:hypothetical protein